MWLQQISLWPLTSSCCSLSGSCINTPLCLVGFFCGVFFFFGTDRLTKQEQYVLPFPRQWYQSSCIRFQRKIRAWHQGGEINKQWKVAAGAVGILHLMAEQNTISCNNRVRKSAAVDCRLSVLHRTEWKKPKCDFSGNISLTLKNSNLSLFFSAMPSNWFFYRRYIIFQVCENIFFKCLRVCPHWLIVSICVCICLSIISVKCLLCRANDSSPPHFLCVLRFKVQSHQIFWN